MRAGSVRRSHLFGALCWVPLTIWMATAEAEELWVPYDFPVIQEAIDAAIDGDTVIVTDGVWTGPGNRDLDLLGKAITVRSASGDPALCTIDCGGTASDRHRGFYLHGGETTGTVVQAFTISGGYDFAGGGVLCTGDSSPTIVDCLISNNTARQRGAGVCCQESSSPTIANCTISDNTLVDGSGGGLYCTGYSSPAVIGCTISRHSANDGGGVLCDYYSRPTFRNCVITGNDALGAGGVLCGTNAQMMLIECTITGNSAAGYGGGVTARNCTLIGCTIAGNTAGDGGGGIRCRLSDVTLINCVIKDNMVETAGGGVYCNESDATFVNCAITGNVADHGAGVYSADVPSPTFVNCTIARNTAETGGGMACAWGSTPALENCILWSDLPSEIHVYMGTPTLTYCDVQGGWSGAGNTNVDPVFVAPLHGDYRLSPGSPCIDSGNNDAVPADLFNIDDDGDTAEPTPFDLAGHVRLFDDLNTPDSGLGTPPVVDRGAYEYQGPVTLCVPEYYATIQAAIDAAVSGDEVIVADGVWTGQGNRDLDLHGKAITVRSASDDPTACVIDCEGSWSDPHRGFHFHNGETTNTVVRGFTIRNGESELGSGVYCDASSPTIDNCVITGNGTLNYPGGGLYCDSASPVLLACTLSSNTALSGGGVYCISGAPTLLHCTIADNTAVEHGAGACWVSTSPELTECTISGNTGWSGSEGGGLYAESGSLLLSNCTITANAAFAGGGLYFDHSDATLTGCTTNGNTADSYGGGVYCVYSSPTFANCTSSSNDAGVFGGGVYCQEYSSPTFSESEIADNLTGGGVVCAYYCNPTFAGCTISSNRGVGAGGLHCVDHSRPVLSNCVIAANIADGGGGGVLCLMDSSPTIVSCTIAGNAAIEGGGGGLCCVEGSNPTITNSRITENTAMIGGGVHCWMADPVLDNCTIAGNTADSGGGILCEETSAPTLTNCILWSDLPQEIFVYSGTPTVTFCDVQGGWPGAGNIDADPLFSDPDGPDDDPGTWADNRYCLLPGSPCIDAGNNDLVPADVCDVDDDGNTTEPLPFDLGGLTRFANDPDTADTGVGTPPVVDMGTHELHGRWAGDVSCDGIVDYDDVDVFVAALGCPGGESTCWPPDGVPCCCPWLNADCDGDGNITYADIDRFIALIGTTYQ